MKRKLCVPCIFAFLEQMASLLWFALSGILFLLALNLH